ncbi:hypothetical protein Pfo_020830 [Paulownia fortunei]|nr:hypothetical protein Pfo_020830 [Paulownia fortunei]
MNDGVPVPISLFQPQNISSGESCEAVIGLSWNPKLPSLSTTKSESFSCNTFCRSNSQLTDGLFLLHPRKLNKLFKKQVKDNWFDMPAQIISPELKKDIQLLKLRSALDPKRHYNKGDSKSKTLKKNFQAHLIIYQAGTVIESASEYYTGRLSKKERKTTLADELLLDGILCEYRKRKVREIEEVKRPAGMDKWKINKSGKHAKAGKGNTRYERLKK